MCLEITLNASPIINVISVVTACPSECICLSQTQVSSITFIQSKSVVVTIKNIAGTHSEDVHLSKEVNGGANKETNKNSMGRLNGEGWQNTINNVMFL